VTCKSCGSNGTCVGGCTAPRPYCCVDTLSCSPIRCLL
jgi:hypothetical protein